MPYNITYNDTFRHTIRDITVIYHTISITIIHSDTPFEVK